MSKNVRSNNATEEEADARLQIENLTGAQSPAENFTEDVRQGLGASPKRLLPKYFYDTLGSQLFEAICLLPEYYLTRAEDEIFAAHADEIVGCLGGAKTLLVEMGSGSATKTRRIIEALLKRQRELLYIPVDISATALKTSAHLLLEHFSALRIKAYASDYHTAFESIREDAQASEYRVLALFLGSNIGNFDHAEAEDFLRRLRRNVLRRAGDTLLLGADLRKDAPTLEAAYDDSLGVTAAFNLNLLARINRELDADFNPREFRHIAFYNEEAGRVEVYLESKRAQTVHIRRPDYRVEFAAGERIHTEYSHKYSAAELSALAHRTGYTHARTWLDGEKRFSSNLFVAGDEYN